jgi:hypothetical protein
MDLFYTAMALWLQAGYIGNTLAAVLARSPIGPKSHQCPGTRRTARAEQAPLLFDPWAVNVSWSAGWK